MADLLDEDLVPFAKGIRSLPGRPHISTGYRFISERGCRGVVLETILVGGRRYTSRQALRRFVAAVTVSADRRSTPTPTTPPPANRRARVDAGIERKLDEAGI